MQIGKIGTVTGMVGRIAILLASMNTLSVLILSTLSKAVTIETQLAVNTTNAFGTTSAVLKTSVKTDFTIATGMASVMEQLVYAMKMEIVQNLASMHG